MFRIIIALILSASALSAAEHSPYITDKQISFFEEHRSEEFGVHGQLVWYKHLGTVWGTTIQQYRIECSAEERRTNACTPTLFQTQIEAFVEEKKKDLEKASKLMSNLITAGLSPYASALIADAQYEDINVDLTQSDATFHYEYADLKMSIKINF